jgi:hypothetical protein
MPVALAAELPALAVPDLKTHFDLVPTSNRKA